MSDSLITLARALKIRRLQLDHSQEEASSKLRVSRGLLSTWESGSFPVKVVDVDKLAAYLGMEAVDVLALREAA